MGLWKLHTKQDGLTREIRKSQEFDENDVQILLLTEHSVADTSAPQCGYLKVQAVS